MQKTRIFTVTLILASFIIAFSLYDRMPLQMASHWGIDGNVNGFILKIWGLFLIPTMSLFAFLLFVAIPYFDPLKKNIEKFRKYYEMFIFLFTLFLFYIYCLTIAWNLGYYFNMDTMITPAFAILFFYIGILTENAKRNWFIGIRTPWTLSSDKVWDKTHKLGGKFFKIFGILFIGAIFLQPIFFFIIVVAAVLGSLYLMLYSYLEYKKEEKSKKRKK